MNAVKAKEKIRSVVEIRRDFPILERLVNGKPLVYLDNAATSQKPRQVIDAMSKYYEMLNSNVHRGIHRLSEDATLEFEDAHKKVAEFINADGMEEIIFTKNTTESLNLLAYSLGLVLNPGDEIVLTQMEHHSNLVPWQQIAKRVNAKVKYLEIDKNGKLKTEFSEIINKKTKIVSVAHVSNVLGTVNPIEEIGKIAKENGALFIVDAAQSVPRMPVDVKDIDCDFLAFSGHKMLGPTGIGVLFGKKEILESMEPFIYGGGMIREVTFEGAKWNSLPWKFEAGTPPIAEAIGLSSAIDYLNSVGLEWIKSHEKKLVEYALERLNEIKDIEIYGPEKRAGIISFNIKGMHAHDLSTLLDQEGIAIRGGHHCAMPLMTILGVAGTARVSFYLYNTPGEIDRLVETIGEAKKIFRL